MSKGKTRTLLINPPQTFYPGSQRFSKSFPLGLAYVAAVLDGEGYPVEILDTLVTGFEVRRRNGIRQYGMSWKNIEKEIRHRHPNIVGISCPFTAQVENAIRVSAIVKEVDPTILTVIGGPDASVRASDILEQARTIDIAVMGEGELTMRELVAKYDEGNRGGLEQVRGIAYRRGEAIIVNARRDFISNLDELPLPAYHLFDMDAYLNPQDVDLYAYRFRKGLRELPLITSRGCPYDCVFCSIHLHMGKRWRAHSASQVLDHLGHVIERYGVNHIHFEDDNFTLNQERVRAILDGIIARGLRFTWDTPNGVRADLLAKDVLAKMKQTGCLSLTVGIESGDQAVLDNIVGKRLKLARVVETATACQEVGIPLQAFFVLGFPGERIENMERTVAFGEMLAESHEVRNHFLVATPLYGTKLYQICKDKGYLVSELTPEALSRGTQVDGSPLIRTEDFGPQDIRRVLAKHREKEARRERERYVEEIYQRFGRLGKVGRLLAGFYLSPIGSGLRAVLRPVVRRVLRTA